MAEAALELPIQQATGVFAPFEIRFPEISIDREIITVGLILALLQVADGVLTGIGMSLHGLSAEGNPVLRFLMHQIGYVPALVLTKSLSIAIVATLCVLATKIRWVISAMKVIALVYLGAAVIPWSILLCSTLLLS